jgi:predicted signal transduction protein with EAL and GGDEF domain
VVSGLDDAECGIVLPRSTEGVDARRVADNLLESVGRPYLVGGDEHHLGCSIGISIYPDDAQTVDLMLRNADSAMFNAKEAGRGRYMFFDAVVNRAAAARTELERDLRRALANGEFSVAYQPQIDLRGGHIDTVEALVRWRHPTRGMVPPVEFIAVAEGAGLIAQIGEFVMRTACAQFSAWDEENIAPRHLAVNVSGLEIVRTDIVARVESVLRDTGLRPMHLELELTEGVFLDHAAESLEKLRQLQERGVRIAMDDFGTGYSSLSYLQRLPIDVIKIDQSFVRELGSSDDSGSIVRAILEVARGLGKSVVAEGIETEQQRALLAGWGCDVGQGYLWSQPLGAAEFGDFCRAWQRSNQPAARSE